MTEDLISQVYVSTKLVAATDLLAREGYDLGAVLDGTDLSEKDLIDSESRTSIHQHILALKNISALRCLIPGFDGAIHSMEWKDALWDRYVTAAPRQRTPSEQQYSDRKLRTRS